MNSSNAYASSALSTHSDGRLLARHSGKQTLMKRLRPYLSDVAAAVGISTRIVPHQLRHTYASEMVRAGLSLPALMTLLGHVKAEMTMKYVLVAGDDLQREFRLARSQPRHLVPQSRKRQSFPRAQVWKVLSILYSSLNTLSRCSVARCRTALSDIVSISSPIGWSRSSPKPANSTPQDNEQRLAG